MQMFIKVNAGGEAAQERKVRVPVRLTHRVTEADNETI
jgi:hypothetical protein